MSAFHPTLLRCLRWLLWRGGLAWSAWFLALAFKRWSYIGVHARSFGPFMYHEMVPGYMRATDWRTPLLMATLPLAVVGAWHLLRQARRRLSPASAGLRGSR